MGILKRLYQDESGASAAEYALILALVGATIAIAAVALGTQIGNAVQRTSDCIDAGSTATAADCG